MMKILMADGTDFIDYLKDNGIDKERLMGEWMNGYETCKYKLAQFLMPQLEELAKEESYKADAERYRFWLNKYCFSDATNHRLNLDKEMQQNKPTKGVTNE